MSINIGLPAGRELDLRIAREVMGLKKEDHAVTCRNCAEAGETYGVLPYSTDTLEATAILEKDDGWGHDWLLERHGMSSQPWFCRALNLTSGKRFTAFAETVALAICRCALKAVAE